MPTKKYWDLIAAYLSGNILPEEQKELELWRRESPLNEQLFSEAEQIWITSDSLKEEFAPDIESAWKRLKENIEKPIPKSIGIKSKIISFPKWLKIAASFILLIGIGYMFKIIFTDTSPSELIAEDIKQTEIQTADSVITFFLPDSSQVWLNVKSKFSYLDNYNDTARIVTLSGEAYFEVRYSEKEFMVFAGENIITVTGTSFNVRAYEEDKQMEVSVISGEVEFSHKDKPEETVRIRENETLTYDKSIGKSQKQKSKKQNKWWESASGKVEKFIKKIEKGIKKEFKKNKK